MKNLSLLAVLLLLLTCTAASAAVIVEIRQDGANVTATATGSLNVSSPISSATATVFPIIFYNNASDFSYVVGVGGGSSATAFTFPFATTTPLNTVAIDQLSDSNTGGPVGVGNGGVLYTPVGYVSGGPINSSSTWNNTTLQALGLSPGSYLFNYTTDSITFNVVGYSVGGNVSGLSGSVTLQNNDTDDLMLNGDGPFTFAATFLTGEQYDVSVLTQPAGQVCTVTNGDGVIGTTDVINVAVSCVDDNTIPPPVDVAPIPVNSPLTLALMVFIMTLLGGAALLSRR